MKRKKLRTMKALRAEAWILFSIYTRSKDADFRGYVRCYTCGKSLHWTDANSGHYRHDAYDFDERNVKCQCPTCNLAEAGRADNFYLHLVREYGTDVAEKLRKRKKWNAYSRQELMEIIEKYMHVKDTPR